MMHYTFVLCVMTVSLLYTPGFCVNQDSDAIKSGLHTKGLYQRTEEHAVDQTFGEISTQQLVTRIAQLESELAKCQSELMTCRGNNLPTEHPLEMKKVSDGVTIINTAVLNQGSVVSPPNRFHYAQLTFIPHHVTVEGMF